MSPLVERTRDGHVALCRLNRPEARNALSPELMEEHAAAVEEADADVCDLIVASETAEFPIAVRLAKKAVLAADEMRLAPGLVHERRLYEIAMATEDRIEGMDAFLQKRRPEFRGR